MSQLAPAPNKLQQRIDLLEKELATAQASTTAATRAKAEFLSNMNHEIRTPLNAVLGFSRLLSNEDLSPSQQEKLGHISDSAGALLGIINDIITLSKIENRKVNSPWLNDCNWTLSVMCPSSVNLTALPKRLTNN